MLVYQLKSQFFHYFFIIYIKTKLITKTARGKKTFYLTKIKK